MAVLPAITLPRPGRHYRQTAIVAGLAVFIWLSLEDNHTLPVILYGALLSGLLIVRQLLLQVGGRPLPWRMALFLSLLTGGAVGAGTAGCTVLLMLVKNAWHAHVFLDFPPDLVGAILSRAPVWGIAGALIGGGLLLLTWLRQSPAQSEPLR